MACVVNVNLLAMRIFPSTVTLNHSLARSCFERADDDDFGNGQRMSNDDEVPMTPRHSYLLFVPVEIKMSALLQR